MPSPEMLPTFWIMESMHSLSPGPALMNQGTHFKGCVGVDLILQESSLILLPDLKDCQCQVGRDRLLVVWLFVFV